MDFSLQAVDHEVVTVDDQRVAPLLASLTKDYVQRYGDGGIREMSSFPAEEFQAPYGKFIILLFDGITVAGGAYRRFNEHTAEIKRIWTHPDFRRKNLASKTLTILEQEAAANGYSDIYLSTGPRQPEAIALYMNRGFTPDFDPSTDLSTLREVGFTKRLPANDQTETINV